MRRRRRRIRRSGGEAPPVTSFRNTRSGGSDDLTPLVADHCKPPAAAGRPYLWQNIGWLLRMYIPYLQNPDTNCQWAQDGPPPGLIVCERERERVIFWTSGPNRPILFYWAFIELFCPAGCVLFLSMDPPLVYWAKRVAPLAFIILGRGEARLCLRHMPRLTPTAIVGSHYVKLGLLGCTF